VLNFHLLIKGFDAILIYDVPRGDMKKRIDSTGSLIGALLCGACGVLLWRNLTLHYAEVEEILPGLRSSDLLAGKGFFLFCIGIALIYSVWVISWLPWKLFKSSSLSLLRWGLTISLFVASFFPLFWFRFGLTAFLIFSFLLLAFLFCLIALTVISVFLANRITLPRLPKTILPALLNPWMIATLLFMGTLYLSHHCFNFLPHIEDSIAQLLQAKIFALGQVWAKPFKPPEFFYFSYMLDADKWFSMYPPGHSLLLTLGVLLKMPFIINPLLGFSSILLFYYLVKETDDDLTARWSAFALAISPFLIFMSSEYMNHMTALAASLIGWVGLARARHGKIGWLLLSGAAFGYCAATRPLEGFSYAILGGIYLLTFSQEIRFSHWRRILYYAIAFFIGVSPFFIYNQLTTGNPLLTGYKLVWGVSGLGLGNIGWLGPHTLVDGFVNTSMSLSALNVYLYETPIPALLGVFLWGWLGSKLTGWEKAFFLSMVIIPAGYFFFYAHDFCFGPRYYHVILPQLVYFTVKGVRSLYARLTSEGGWDEKRVRRGLVYFGGILFILQFFVAVPFRASIYADSYWGTDDAPYREAKRLDLHHAIIFVENHPWSVLQTKLHHFGFTLGDSQRLIFVITRQGFDEVLEKMGYDPDEAWNRTIDKKELEKGIDAWSKSYLASGNSPVDPWKEKGEYVYFSNAALHLDPKDHPPDVIIAQDLGKHNSKLMELYPDRKAYRYSFDESSHRFRLLPLN
jgi:4-amino-4-deoxy-L-arabinose transferase-like glycosyltransferase